MLFEFRKASSFPGGFLIYLFDTFFLTFFSVAIKTPNAFSVINMCEFPNF